MRRKVLTVLTVVMMGLLTACNSTMANTDRNTLVIKSDQIQEIAVEDYSGIDFTKEELEAYVNEQVAKFTASNSGVVTFEELQVGTPVVKLSMTYDTLDTYNAFHGTKYEMVSGVSWDGSGMAMDGFVKPDGSAISEADLKSMLTGGAQVFLVYEGIDIILPGEVLAVSGATVLESGTVRVEAPTEGIAATEVPIAAVLYK